jgi:hypothetical protein
LLLGAALVCAGGTADGGVPEDVPALPDTVEFNRDIRPILLKNCYQGQGPDPKASEAQLRLDTRQGIFAKFDQARVVVAPSTLDKS